MPLMDWGGNFRATSGYVADVPPNTYVLDTDSYPTVRGGATMGWTSAPTGARDRSNDATFDELAGINFGNSVFY